MKRKYIVLAILIALSLFSFFSSQISFLNFFLSIGGALVFWGIFIWGYDNPEAKG